MVLNVPVTFVFFDVCHWCLLLDEDEIDVSVYVVCSLFHCIVLGIY